MRLTSILMLLVMLPLGAQAGQGDLPIRTSGFYVGASVGSGDAEIKTEFGAISGADTAWRLTVGYRWWDTFMPWDIDLGLELGYVELGERDNRLSDMDTWQLENHGLTAALAGFWPLTRHFDLIGKAGLVYSDTTLSNQSIDIPSASDNSTDVLVGAGIAWRSSGPLSAAIEYEYYGTLDGAALASFALYYQFK